MKSHQTVDNYMTSIRDEKEVLSDPNKNLSASEIRLGKGKAIKRLTKTEKSHEKILLGDLYQDKEFLRFSYVIVINYNCKKCITLKVCLQTS